MALDATVGGVGANSYALQSVAAAYFADRLDIAEWTAATSAQKDAALIMATARLDTETYAGARVFYDQRLQWPRFSAYDRDGVAYNHQTIPLPVEQATFELALAILKRPAFFADSGLEGFKELEVGEIRIVPRWRAAASLPDTVSRFLAPVLKSPGGAYIVRA